MFVNPTREYVVDIWFSETSAKLLASEPKKTLYDSGVEPTPAVQDKVASIATPVLTSEGLTEVTHVGGKITSDSVVKLFTAQLLDEPPALFAVTDQK